MDVTKDTYVGSSLYSNNPLRSFIFVSVSKYTLGCTSLPSTDSQGLQDVSNMVMQASKYLPHGQ